MSKKKKEPPQNGAANGSAGGPEPATFQSRTDALWLERMCDYHNPASRISYLDTPLVQPPLNGSGSNGTKP